MTIGDIIKARRLQLGLTLEDIAKALKVSKSTVSRYESKEIENMGIDKIEALARVLKCSPSHLMGWESKSFTFDIAPCALPHNTYRIPVLGSIPAGVPLEAVEDIIGWEEIPEEWLSGGREYYGLRVKGDSMYPEYWEGDIVIIRKQSTCDTGDDCAVMINTNEATLKRVHLHKDDIELEALNKMYGRRKFTQQEIASLPVTILGVIVELRRKKK